MHTHSNIFIEEFSLKTINYIMKKLSKEQIIEQLEDGIEQLKNIFSETVIENEQERIIRKNRIIAKLERENEKLRIKLQDKNIGTS